MTLYRKKIIIKLPESNLNIITDSSTEKQKPIGISPMGFCSQLKVTTKDKN